MTTDRTDTRRGRPVAIDPGDRRRMVFAAMDRVFECGGARALTMDAVSREAGMSKRTVYALFGSREGLLAAYLEHVSQAYSQPLPAGAASWPLAQRLTHLLRPPDREVGRDLPLAVLRILISLAPEHPHLGRKVLATGRDRIELRLRDELLRAERDGEIALDCPDAAARLLFDMARPDALAMLLDPERRDSREAGRARVDMAIRVFLHGAARC